MKNVSLKIEDSIFGETEEILQNLKQSRNSYINDALNFYNNWQRKQLIEKKLKRESVLVSKNSLEVLKEFEMIENEEESI